MASGDAYDVFVSYARSDEADAAELNGLLCAQGFRTFFDRSALHPGLRWVPALEEAIGRSKAVAILVGRHGIGNTQQYERELALVRQTGDATFPVIPVLMPGCESPPTGFLQLLTWVDLSNGKNVREQTDSLAALCAALRGETVEASALRASICPYRGLEPFREEDAAFFCGRDDAIRELVAHVQEHPLVAVVGPSGSGKSSLVFAGLLPALRKDGRTKMWDVVTLRPGKRPLHALAEAFGTIPVNAGKFETEACIEKEASFLRTGNAEMLARAVDRRLDAASEKPDRLLIYIDQWEELYAMAPTPEDKARVAQHGADVERFIELLVAASQSGSRAGIVITVRADFYNPLIRNPLLSALLPKQQVNIPPMSRDDLRAAIETPAKTARLSFEPLALVDRILDDVGLEEGRLPLLQFALKETWEKRAGDKLTAEAYTAVGGVARAIEKTAEDAYERLTRAQKDAARRLFLRLVTPGEGQADTRARSAIPDDALQREIINRFSSPKSRLLVTALQPGPGGGEARATVEVAHEALIQRWSTLRDWVHANRENMRARAAVLRAKGEWEEHGQDEKFLLDPGVQLERGRALLENPGDVPVDDVRGYLNLSVEKELRRVAEQEKQSKAAMTIVTDVSSDAPGVRVMTVSEGETWHFSATGEWTNGFIQCGPNGYTNFIADVFQIEPRVPGEPWMRLMGEVDGEPGSIFRIGFGCTRKFETSGMLVVFANDRANGYADNNGVVQLHRRLLLGKGASEPTKSPEFREVFNRIRGIPVIAALVLSVSCILIFMPQGQDLVRGVGEDYSFQFPSGLLQIAFALGLLFFAFQAWSWSRIIVTSNYGIDRGLWRPRWLLEWMPRLLGVLPFLGAIGALLINPASNSWFVLALISLGLLFFAFVVWRLDIGRRLARQGTLHRLRLSQRNQVILSFFGAAGAMLLATMWPVAFGSLLGAPAAVFFGLGFIIPVIVVAIQLGFLGVLGIGRTPVVGPLIAVGVIFGLWVDNHQVGRRAFTNGTTGPIDRLSLTEAFQQWRAAQQPGTADAKKTMVLVAVQGGASRAGYWAALALSSLREAAQARGVDLDRHIFAISSVSGGSVGAIGYAAMLKSAPDAPDFKLRLLRFAGQDALGPAMTGMLFPDLLQRFLPVTFLPDRAETLERSWEDTWAMIDPASPEMMRKPFLTLAPQADEPWRPILIVQGASENSGRRILTSGVAFSCDEIDADDCAPRRREEEVLM
jgi:hypothetical protein